IFVSRPCRAATVLYRLYRRGSSQPTYCERADGIFCLRRSYRYGRGRADDFHFVPHKAVAQSRLIARPRNPFMVIPTPLPGLAAVTQYYDTWFDKITKSHLEMVGKEDAVRLVVSSPT